MFGDVDATHHNLDRYLDEYIRAAGIAEDRKGPLFRTVRGRSGELTGNSLLQSDVWRMIRRRALAAGIKTEIGCHTFRATGITAYLKNGGRLEIAQHRWRRTNRPGQQAFTIGAMTRFHSMRSSALESNSPIHACSSVRTIRCTSPPNASSST